MQIVLPHGFDSWAQILTDWSVARAYDAARPFVCIAGRSELAAPLVAEVGMTIRDIQLRRRPIALDIHRERVTEPAYDEMGGASYLEASRALEEITDRCWRASQQERRILRCELERLRTTVHNHRWRAEPFVQDIRRRAVKEFWAANTPRGLNDNFFAHGSHDSAPSRLSRIDPAWWWRDFFTKLQCEFVNRHAADGCFLDALPNLRARANRKKLEGMIRDWTEVHREKWGWDGPGHYRMLAIRAQKKADELSHWYDNRAPSFRYDNETRRILHDQLAQLLASVDPLGMLGRN